MRALLFVGVLLLISAGAWAQDDAAPDAPQPEDGDAGVAADDDPDEDASDEESASEGDSEDDVDPASDPPPQPLTLEATSTLNTRVSGRLRSEMFFTQRPKMRRVDGATYATSSDNVFPFYETIELRADEIGHKGLSVHFQGWAGLDLADVYFDQRFVADPTFFYLQFRDYGLDAKVGRVMVYSGVAQGLNLDGGHISYELPIHLGIEGMAGLVVSPVRGPDWYREQPGVDADSFGAGFSDWDREGDWAAGGRLFYRKAGKISAGVSFLHVTEFSEINRQIVGADIDMTPVKWLGATGNASMDLLAKDLREANAALDFYPVEVFSFSLEYRHANPTLYLSKMSIFSVFSTEEYDSVGAAFRVKPKDWLHLHTSYHQHFYSFIEKTPSETDILYESAIEPGYEITVGASAHYGVHHQGLVLVDYRRLGEQEQAVDQIRAGLVVPLKLEGLKTAANVYLDLYKEEINDTKLGLLGDLGLFYGNKTIEAGGSFAGGTNPYAKTELRGMLRFNYNFDVSFSERRAN